MKELHELTTWMNKRIKQIKVHKMDVSGWDFVLEINDKIEEIIRK